MEKEYRKIQELRANDNSRHVEGYAIIFNSLSEDLGFYETIEKTAIDDDVIKKSDCFCLLDHNSEKVLARSKYGVGNLKLEIDDKGLKYSFDALDNELGNTLLSYIRSGIIDSSSFCFTVAKDHWETKDGEDYRTVEKIDMLFDVSPVYTPAYAATSVSCRSYDKYKEEKSKQSDIQNLCDEILAME